MSDKSIVSENEDAQPSSIEIYDDVKVPALSFPEGGMQAWCTVLGAFLAQFATFGYLNAFGVYQDFYIREYLTNYTPRDIGWIGGMQICLVFGSGILTGRAFDRGYFYHLMIGGSLLHVFCLFMLSLTQKNQYYQIILSQGLGVGLASGMTYLPSLTVPVQYFQRKRAVAIGIVSSGSALGAVIHPIMLNKLFHSNAGFHNGVRISATMNTALFVVALLLMRTRLPPAKKGGHPLPVIEFLRDPPYLFSILGGVFFMGGIFLPQFYLQLDAISHGMDEKFVFYCISILNAASFVGRIIPPLFARRLGAFNLFLFVTLAMAITLFCYILAKNEGGYAVIAICFGFFSGAAIALTASVITPLAKDMSEYGARIGIYFTALGFVGLFSSPILGALLTSDMHSLRAVLFGGITMLASTSCFAVSRAIVARRKGTQIL